MGNTFFTRKHSFIKNTALGLGLALGLTLPLAENTARAQQVQVAQASVNVAQPGSYSIKSRAGNNGLAKREMNIENKQESLKVHFVYPPENEFSVLEMQGPAKFVVYFYPFLNREITKKGQDVEIKVTYKLDGVERPINATTGISNYKLNIQGVKVHKLLAIGIPIIIEGNVPNGKHELLITGPKGVFRVGHVENTANSSTQSEPIRQTQTTQSTGKVATEPEQEEDESLGKLPVFTASYEHLSLIRPYENDAGNNGENENTINGTNISFSPLHTRRLALMLGGFGNYDSASIRLANDFEGRAKFYSFGGNVGVAFALPRQLLLVNAFGGARKMNAILDYGDAAITVDNASWQAQFGLKLSYEFTETLRANAKVSNSPILPAQFNLALELPISLARWNLSELETNLLYFQLLEPEISTSTNGTNASFTSDRYDVISRTTLSLPFLDLSKILFSFVGGYEAEAIKNESLEHLGMAGLSARIRILRSELSLGGLYLTDGNFAVSALLDLLAGNYSFQADFIQLSPSKPRSLREASVRGEKYEGN